MQAVQRPSFAVKFNLGKVVPAFALFFVMMFFADPAFAQASSDNCAGDFQQFCSKITGKTKAASDTAVTILRFAAVLALLIGLAPMLWGQMKVKWVVSCLCACVLFGLASIIVPAFAS